MDSSLSSRSASSSGDSVHHLLARGGSTKMRKFDGHARNTGDWDGLRKDEALWREDGNCIVHFYAHGASQRKPSLKLPYSLIEGSRSPYLLEQCTRTSAPSSPVPSVSGSSTRDSGYHSPSRDCERKKYELYVPVPSKLSKAQAFSYHVTSRNYFAFLTSQSLVGETLGATLQDLWQRVLEWHPHESLLADFMQYCEDQGYLSLASNPVYSTAMLALADSATMSELWIHAFAHCVAMNDHIDLTPDYDRLSNTTKALITRASLEMDLHLARVTRAVGGFLEEQLGTEYLGLSKAARDHLDRFRSFLHAYYVDKLGYFPPGETEAFDKDLWTGIYHDFHSLYDYIVDKQSDLDMTHNRGANTGVCVLQNVQAFDSRHGYQPLPHPVPLLPEVIGPRHYIDTQKGLLGFKLGKTDSSANKKLTARHALTVASNINDGALMSSPIVQEYQRFERQKLEEKISVAEARNVRWILIYGTLQMLISITKAPKDVKDADTAPYPLCILTTNCPPWSVHQPTEHEPESQASEQPDTGLTPTQVDTDDHISIHPDCEADNAQSYFSLSRRASQLSMDFDAAPAPLRITVPISRTASIRSSVGALHRSVIGSISRRNSLRKVPLSTPRKSSSFCEILVEGYGNGSNSEDYTSDRDEALRQLEGTTPQSSRPQSSRNPFSEFDFGLGDLEEEPALENFEDIIPAEQTSEPILDDSQLFQEPTSWHPEDFSVPTSAVSDSSDLTGSGSDFTSSARSSYMLDCSTPLTAMSSFSLEDRKSPINFDKRLPSLPMHRRASYQQPHLNFGTSTRCMSLNIGCYTPSGYVEPAVSKFAVKMPPAVRQVKRVDSTGSMVGDDKSDVSSLYTVNERQAAEIEEEESRGRRRSRALDQLAQFNWHAS